MTKLFSVSLTTNTTTYTTTIETDISDADDYQLAMMAVSRIAEEDGFDLTHRRWDIQVEELGN